MNHQEKIALDLATMQSLTFGVEIETVGISRMKLAAAIVKAIPGSVSRYAPERGYDRWIVTMPDGREWSCMSDGSITGGSGSQSNGEVVTPICTWADLDVVQTVVREIRHAGARVDSTCGVHVHVGVPAERFDAAALVRLAKLTYQQEPLIFAALRVASHRAERWAKPVDLDFITRLAAQRPASREALSRAWYDSAGWRLESAQRTHYHESRYHGLNMHAVFYRGTVEFRYFEATLHAGIIKANVQFCLALAAKALTSKTAIARKRTFNPATAKYDFRVFLLRLGMIGDTFKTARLHLMANLEGSASRKHGDPPAALASDAPAAPDAPATPSDPAAMPPF